MRNQYKTAGMWNPSYSVTPAASPDLRLKQSLLASGWTADGLRERIAGCRSGLREARAMNGPGLFTYRLLYVTWYVNYRRMLAVLPP